MQVNKGSENSQTNLGKINLAKNQILRFER